MNQLLQFNTAIFTYH